MLQLIIIFYTWRYCYCENDFKRIQSTNPLSDPLCQTQCPGNGTQLCGSLERIRFDTLTCNWKFAFCL